MSTREADFRVQIATVLADLQDNAQQDRQTMREVGALAAGLVDKANVPSWGALKQRLMPDALESLLLTFKREGQALLKAGHMRPAYAVQTLSLSLVARTYQDAAIREGETLLDAVIEGAIDLVRREPAPTTTRT
jgi:hypothetical protein